MWNYLWNWIPQSFLIILSWLIEWFRSHKFQNACMWQSTELSSTHNWLTLMSHSDSVDFFSTGLCVTVFGYSSSIQCWSQKRAPLHCCHQQWKIIPIFPALLLDDFANFTPYFAFSNPLFCLQNLSKKHWQKLLIWKQSIFKSSHSFHWHWLSIILIELHPQWSWREKSSWLILENFSKIKKIKQFKIFDHNRGKYKEQQIPHFAEKSFYSMAFLFFIMKKMQQAFTIAGDSFELFEKQSSLLALLKLQGERQC